MVVIGLLRGVNLGPHKRMKMEALCGLCASLDLESPQTYVQSGNVLFKTRSRDLVRLAASMEKEIERKFGFHSDVVLRSCSDMRDIVARNPFASRRNIDPKKLLVTFLAADPSEAARAKLRQVEAEPEELWIDGRELFIYFPNGLARPKLSIPLIERTLKTSGTGRNWNTVMKLLELAEAMETDA